MAATTHSPAVSDQARAARVVVVGDGPLTIDDVVDVARHGARVRLADAAVEAMAASRAVVEGLADDDRPHYGVSTGFGALARRHIPVERRAQLQLSLVRSHAAGSGPEVEREVVRALQLLRLATLATGRTGARPVVAQTYAAMLDAGITPVVREFGSLGCSGDLAPLAHVALAALGEGEVRDATGAVVPAADALAAAGIAPLALREKEGLALINGTDGMLGMLALALHDLRSLLTTADVAALLGSDAPFAADLVAMRPHPGQAASAANLRALLDGSPVVASHRTLDADGRPECTRVQDAYSLRCAPQVHGAARDTLDHATAVARRELAAAIDNPVVTVDGRVESNGNFHGAPVAYVLDFLAIAAADVASMSERRTDRFLDKARNEGLPPFLADDPGVDSGLMIAQYTAAGIVSELKRLAVPSSVDSIPSSAMLEDHVSMGWAGARKLRRAVDGLGRVLAIELLTATRALDLRCDAGSLHPARGTGAVRDLVRTAAAGPGPDRYLAPEIEAVTHLVATGAVTAAASAAVGHLA
ncbi:MAG: histidine ammonia-lyase [Cellulosimicrobium funkei]